MTASAGRIRRTKYLIAKGFQLRFAILLAGIGVTVSAIVGLVLYVVLARTQEMLVGTGIVMSPQVVDFLTAQRGLYVNSLLGVFFGVTLLLLVFGIFVSHRLAGPIFALSRKMNELAHGNFNAILTLRKGDELQDLKEQYNTLVHALRNQVQSELLKLSGMIESIEKVLGTEMLTTEEEHSLREVYRELQSYYTYKKSLIETSSTETFKPNQGPEDEILV